MCSAPEAGEGGEAAAIPVRGPGWLRYVNGALLVTILLALLLHPTQITVRQWAELLSGALGVGGGLAARIPNVNITVSDGLLLVAFCLWLARAVAGRTLWERVRAYPVWLLVLFVCGAFSAMRFLKQPGGGPEGAILNPSLAAAVKELIQFGIFFVCGYAVLADLLRCARLRRLLTVVFLAAAGVAILAGLREYAELRPGSMEAARQGAIVSPTEVDATFGLRSGQTPDEEKYKIATASNRNVLGAWAGLVVPLFWALALWVRRWPARLACGAAALGGMLLLLQGGLWAAALVGVLIVAHLRGRWAMLATAGGLALFWGLVFGLGPQQHGLVLMDSVMLRKEYDRFYVLRQYYDDATGWAAGKYPGEGPEPRDLFYAGSESNWQARYAEWQPGLQAVAQRPLFGVGLGSYQDVINRFYDGPGEPTYNPGRVYQVGKHRGKNFMEFGGNSFHLVWMVSTGLVGLLGAVWFLVAAVGRAAGAARAWEGGLERALAVGAVGGLCAMAGGMFFTEYLVRGVGVAVVFLLAASAALAEGPPAPEGDAQRQ